MERADIILISGPPGSGKGTQCDMLVRSRGVAHISTGDILREEIEAGTKAGKLANSLIMEGKFFPDELMLEMLDARLQDESETVPVLLDGFPRNLAQAKLVTDYSKKSGREVRMFIALVLPDEEILSRISGRLLCKDCSRPYHTTFAPPKSTGVCDYCHGELYHRDDDNPKTLIGRLERFHGLTKPMYAYYKELGIYHEVDASKSPNEVFEAISKLI